jgi:hypothetical protein
MRVVISTLCFYISALIGAEISEMKVNFTSLFDISAPPIKLGVEISTPKIIVLLS